LIVFFNSKAQLTFRRIAHSDYVFGVNVRGIVLGIQYSLPLLRKGGKFICTSSGASIFPFGGNPVYAASKAAVDSLVRCYAAQFAESEDELVKSLSVFAINPGFYTSEMSDRFVGNDENVKDMMVKMFNPSQSAGKAEELADIIRQLLAGELPYKSGDAIACDADTHFPLPEWFDRLKVGQERTKAEG
jgi:NAD(P)-dependent dehydrogenase (short-subunit alcohol dehydrogenase family)